MATIASSLLAAPLAAEAPLPQGMFSFLVSMGAHAGGEHEQLATCLVEE